MPASPASAIGWELRRRHRRGLLALGAYLVVLAAIKAAIITRGQGVVFDSAESFALGVVVPIACTFTYALAVFTYGLSGDIAARQSMFPARMFTLPVSTRSLAWWPMAYGALTMATLWAATRLFVAWPSDFDVPVVWPGLLAAVLLAWTQALTWMPYGLAGARVVAAVLLLTAIDTVVLLALHFKTNELVMLAWLAPLLALAFVVARIAVARARSGVVPDWRGALAWIGRAERPAARPPFTSAASAQEWFEWRRHGRSLPTIVAILLPFELLLLWPAGDTRALVVFILLGVLVTPPFMASFVAATVRDQSHEGQDSHGLAPFIATRPMTSATLVGATLRVAVKSTLVTWALVLVAIPAALAWSGRWLLAVEQAQRTAAVMGTARAIVLLLLVVGACVATTWKQLVQSLYIGLTGRASLVKASVMLTLVVVSVIGPALDWIATHPRAEAALWDATPWILVALVTLKMTTAAWLATRLVRGRLLRDRTLVAGAAAWCVVVLALYGMLAWYFATEFFPRHLLMLAAIVAVPLVRESAAPLALVWNRHR